MDAPRVPLSLEERRARREARRVAQREANVGRAEKMHAARISSHDDILSSTSAPLPRVNVGCSGWFYWHWRGVFYPDELPTSQWFHHYSGEFRTVELNAPFYSWPTVASVKKWALQTEGEAFHYTVKVCELITHVKRFQSTKTLVKDFGYIADLLGEKMGCFLFQLPPSYDFSSARLRSIVAQLDPRRRNVVEFRHRSWWNDEVYDAFRAENISFCSCSGPRLPDELITTAKDVYLRFHGTTRWYRHDYTREELVQWADRVKACGAERVWAYFNNDREGYSIKNAHAFQKLISDGTAAGLTQE
jgi:uncharacterized protein YecE (DUF72 family)